MWHLCREVCVPPDNLPHNRMPSVRLLCLWYLREKHYPCRIILPYIYGLSPGSRRKSSSQYRAPCPLQTHEHSERDVMPVLFHKGSAVRAVLIRQIKSAAIKVPIRKFAKPALGAAPVRRQWIYFRNSCHGSNKRRPHRSSGSHKISIVRRFFDQFVCNQVQYAEAIVDDGIQFQLQTPGDRLRQRIAVKFAGAGKRHTADVIISPGNVR